MFSALSEHSILTHYVPLYIALGPVTKLTNTGSGLIKKLSKNYIRVDKLVKKFNKNSVLSRKYVASKTMNYLCVLVP